MIDDSQIPSGEEASAERVRELEQLLEENELLLQSREATVKDLTDRLALAVERLDRVQRVGTDRITVNSAGFPKEVIEQQSALVEDLQRAVEQWENMQVGSGLGKLELQLSDLTALIEEHFQEPEPEPEPEPELPPPEAAENTPNGGITEAAPEGELTTEPSGQEATGAEDDGLDLAAEDVCPLRPPEILNLTDAQLHHLKRCVEQQDRYIDYLSTRLQRAAENPKSVDWESLAAKPDLITKQLEHTVIKLDQSRHFAEFEVALQFTRVRRKDRELKLVSDELAAQTQSLGKSPESEQGKDPASGRRWMRMLGMGKNESE
jgi:hypothetical protein